MHVMGVTLVTKNINSNVDINKEYSESKQKNIYLTIQSGQNHVPFGSTFKFTQEK